MVTSDSTVEETLTGVFTAFLRTVDAEHLSVDQVISLMNTEELKPHAWSEQTAQEVRPLIVIYSRPPEYSRTNFPFYIHYSFVGN